MNVVPFHCPYCAEEDLRPGEQSPDAWECRACNRAFQVTFLGLLGRGPRSDSTGGERI